MSVFMQGKLFRVPLATLGVKLPLGFLGLRRVSDDTKSPKSEQSERVNQIRKTFTNPEQSVQHINQFKPSRRSADSPRFVYEVPTLSERGKEVPMDQWDESLYD